MVKLCSRGVLKPIARVVRARPIFKEYDTNRDWTRSTAIILSPGFQVHPHCTSASQLLQEFACDACRPLYSQS